MSKRKQINKSKKEALERLASYNKDMREGRIDISECVKLSGSTSFTIPFVCSVCKKNKR